MMSDRPRILPRAGRAVFGQRNVPGPPVGRLSLLPEFPSIPARRGARCRVPLGRPHAPEIPPESV